MRVSCGTVVDFIANLQSVTKIFGGFIYLNVNKRASDNEKTKILVTIQVTTIVLTDDDYSFLLEAGELCGRDLVGSKQVLDGSIRCEELKVVLENFCEQKGWKILPGICSE